MLDGNFTMGRVRFGTLLNDILDEFIQDGDLKSKDKEAFLEKAIQQHQLFLPNLLISCEDEEELSNYVYEAFTKSLKSQ